jgi:hypothetical protein
MDTIIGTEYSFTNNIQPYTAEETDDEILETEEEVDEIENLPRTVTEDQYETIFTALQTRDTRSINRCLNALDHYCKEWIMNLTVNGVRLEDALNSFNPDWRPFFNRLKNEYGTPY